MEIIGSGEVIVQGVKNALLDSKSFVVQFDDKTTNRQRAVWFRNVSRMYKEMGGGSIIWQQNPDTQSQYLVRPQDDPEQNY